MDRAALREDLERELAAIRGLIDAGRADEARGRMTGVPVNFTPLGDFARQVGELYEALGYRVLAGRYWYLLPEKTPAMEAACAEFARSCGDNPVLIAEALGRDAPEALVRAKLGELDRRRRCIESEHRHAVSAPVRKSRFLLLMACVASALVVLLAIVGVVELLRRAGVLG